VRERGKIGEVSGLRQASQLVPKKLMPMSKLASGSLSTPILQSSPVDAVDLVQIDVYVGISGLCTNACITLPLDGGYFVVWGLP
jgi:hypothetical protein